MTDKTLKLILTTAEVRELIDSGRTVLRQLIDPQPAFAVTHHIISYNRVHFTDCKSCLTYSLPHGRDGERWVAEEWEVVDTDCGDIIECRSDCDPQGIYAW